MKRIIHFAQTLVVCITFGLSPSLAQQASTASSTVVVPRLIRFAGVLNDSSGHPLTGVAGITFSLYRDQEGGAALWLETQNAALDANGHYEVLLGAEHSEGVPMDLFSSGEAGWLGVQVQGQPTEQPRVLLVSVPYALKAADSQTLGGLPPSAFMLASPSAGGSKSASATPTGRLSASPASVPASSNVTTSGSTVHTLPFFTTATNIQSSIVSQAGTSAIRVKGQLNVGQGEPTDGILNSGPNSSSHVGLSTRGWNAPSGSGSSGSDAIHATGGNGGGAFGGAGAIITGGNTGGDGNLAGAGAIITGGIGGPDTGGSGPGLVARGGAAGLDFGGGDGVDAGGGSPEGIGVVASGGAGGSFENGFPGVMTIGGLAGGATNGPGIVAIGPNGIPTEHNGGDGIDAIAGQCTGLCSSGFAGSFTGDVTISGNLTVSGTKSFKIDHPLDPANKYLYHAAVESSEVLNLYTGNATLDANGEAIVQLPEWFEAINGDFRYQLTAIGRPCPGLYVAQEISGGRFQIAGGSAGTKVSWQVTSIRQDRWEKAHPMVVEMPKTAAERGHYVNPELFGAPPNKNMDWARLPQLMKRIQDLQAKQAKQNLLVPAMLQKRGTP